MPDQELQIPAHKVNPSCCSADHCIAGSTAIATARIHDMDMLGCCCQGNLQNGQHMSCERGLSIDVLQVKLVIGAGGEKIKFIQRKTKCRIQVRDTLYPRPPA